MSMVSVKMKLLSPLPVYLDEAGAEGTLARRPASLDGKTLGLMPNWRPAAASILNSLGELLGQRYNLKGIVAEPPVFASLNQGKKLVDRMREQLDDFASRVDVAITASGD
jgi:hypothetical protein